LRRVRKSCLSSGRPCAATPFSLWEKEIYAPTPQLGQAGRRGTKDGTLFVFYVPDYPPLRRCPFPSRRDRTVHRCPRASHSLRSSRRSGATLRWSGHVRTPLELPCRPWARAGHTLLTRRVVGDDFVALDACGRRHLPDHLSPALEAEAPAALLLKRSRTRNTFGWPACSVVRVGSLCKPRLWWAGVYLLRQTGLIVWGSPAGTAAAGT
jgi:hypothetical protein